MRFDKVLKLLPIVDFALLGGSLPRLWFDIACFGFALEPQVNRITTDTEQLTCLTFLQTVQLNRLHDFLPEIITVGLSHGNGVDVRGNSSSLRPNLDGYSYT